LAEFRHEHGLRRTADYPEARYWFLFGALFIGSFEVLGNRYFFSAGSDFGFLGAFIEAFLAAAINVGTGFLAGHYAARWLEHRRAGWKMIGALLLLGWLAVILVVNLATAHYRDLLEAGQLEDAMRLTVPRLSVDPLGIDSLFSWLLLAFGLLMALLALIDGRAYDDSYPGYGRVARRYDAAQKAFAHARQDLIEGLSDTKADTVEALRKANEDIGRRRTLFHQARAGRKRLDAQLATHLDYLERTQNELLATYHVANRRARTTPPPARFAQPVIIPRPSIEPPTEVYDEATVERKTREASEAALAAVREVAAEFETAFRQLVQLEDVLAPGIAHGSRAQAA
jgi:hypothetical protein